MTKSPTRSRLHRLGALAATLAALLCLAVALSACGSSASNAGSTGSGSVGSTGAGGTGGTSTGGAGGGSGSAKGHGSVNVLYAGSLVNLMETKIGPGFEKATGYSFQGFPAGSSSLAQQIKGKVRQGDVFLSASPAADEDLQGAGNGGWVSWYATFATSPLLLAYNPNSSFASQLKSRPWWQVVTQPGFKLGRTDPKLDPKGVLIVEALKQAASAHHDPALSKLATGTEGVFPEEDLIGRLQSGQLDAGFFYSVESAAVKPKLPTISIAPIDLGATYTITVLKGAPDSAGAAAFVKYLLSPAAKGALTAAGLHLQPPKVTGSSSGVTAALRQALSQSP